MQRIFFNWTIAAIAVLAPALAMAGDSEDKATADQIAALLRDSGRMQNYSVGVQYKGGTVWLTGRVANEKQMQAALQVVSDIEGVEQIVNSLEVAKGSGRKQAGASNQATPGRPAARRVSATSADLATPAGNPAEEQATPADGDVTPAGFHRLAGRRAARHAGPVPPYAPGIGSGPPPAYDQPHMPNYAWPSYAAYPNYAALTYPKQYSASAWPYIGPFYPYPQVPLGWRKVSLEWDDGWWYLDFFDRSNQQFDSIATEPRVVSK
jgi:hypothetical protein